MAGGIPQWYNACLADEKSWIQSPAPQNKQKQTSFLSVFFFFFFKADRWGHGSNPERLPGRQMSSNHCTTTTNKKGDTTLKEATIE
jgi:hypothetical protein